MISPANHNFIRHLLATVIGLPLAVGGIALIPFLTSITNQLHQTTPVMVVDLIEMPKKSAETAAKPVRPEPKTPEKPKAKPPKKRREPPRKKRPKIQKKVAKKITKKPAVVPPKEPPAEKVDIAQLETPKTVTDESPKALPVPTPIFRLSAMPRFLHREEPEYPEKMKRLGRSATVRLKALIDKEGKVRKVIVEQSAGPEFDNAAVTALRKSSFIPGKLKGRPVAVLLRLPVQFRLL